MDIRSQLKEAACNAIDNNRQRIFDLGDSISAEPELGYKEFKTAKKFTALLDELGMSYRSEVARTGVISRCKGKSSKASVAVMGELDAVLVASHPDADPLTGAVHACGHNCMIAALGGVAIALKEANIMEHLDGDVVLMAVPAEEFVELEFRNTLREKGEIGLLGGKQEFIRLGEFDDVDISIMQHISSSNSNEDYLAAAGSVCNGFAGKIIRYTGKEAHAGASPHDGINALNAAMLGLMGVHAQRETFKDEDHIRVHPIITKGGDLVNVVPADVRLETYVRGANTEAILDASQKVSRAFCAGGDAVGAETEIIELPGYLPGLLNDSLMDLMVENLKLLFPEEKVQKFCGGFGGGSSDQGDVSNILPSLQAFFTGACGGLHTEKYCLADKENAYIAAAKALTMMVIDLLYNNAQTALEIKNNFKPVFTKEEYLENWCKGCK